jgi:hypothetical protein
MVPRKPQFGIFPTYPKNLCHLRLIFFFVYKIQICVQIPVWFVHKIINRQNPRLYSFYFAYKFQVISVNLIISF